MQLNSCEFGALFHIAKCSVNVDRNNALEDLCEFINFFNPTGSPDYVLIVLGCGGDERIMCLAIAVPTIYCPAYELA